MSIYVDDVAHASIGVGGRAIAGMALYYDAELAHRLARQLGLPFAKAKARCSRRVANSRGKWLRGLSLQEDAAAVDAVGDLGSNDSLLANLGGRVRTRRVRLQARIGRLRRVMKLRLKPGRATAIAFAGAVPTATFGADVIGVSPTAMTSFEARAARAARGVEAGARTRASPRRS